MDDNSDNIGARIMNLAAFDMDDDKNHMIEI
jgi:hypothetical protein